MPRVVFRDPVNTLRQNPDTLQDHHLYGQFDPNAAGFGTVTADGVPLAPLAPRPSPYEGFNGFTHPSQMGEQYDPSSAGGYTGQGFENQVHPNNLGIFDDRQPHVPITNGHAPSLHSVDRRASATAPTSFSGQEAWASSIGEVSMTPSHAMPSTTWPYDAATSTAQASHYPTPLTGSSNDGTFPTPTWPIPSLDNNRTVQVPPSPAGYDPRRFSLAEDHEQAYVDHQIHPQDQVYGLPSYQPANEPEEDSYDVESDEEDMTMDCQLGEVQPSELGLMIQMSACRNTVDVRSMNNFLNEPNVLATYQPAYAATPLMDPHTARVFCHFITATGPTLNVCERHPANPSVVFSGRPVPEAQRALWSYTMPMLALKHQGLLHSMLALSSLHIAKLQHTSPTPSLKHYHYALRRVAKALGNPVKRCDVATLAATLLLGFYEVTTAEHNKWNSHLSGARELIVEVDYAKMAKRIEAHRTRQEEDEARNRQYEYNGYPNIFSKPSLDELHAKAARKLDENIISTIMGWSTKYNEYGEVIDDNEQIAPTQEPLKQKDIETFQVQCDLFWWYAKQDVYQSILSGNRLL